MCEIFDTAVKKLDTTKAMKNPLEPAQLAVRMNFASMGYSSYMTLKDIIAKDGILSEPKVFWCVVYEARKLAIEHGMHIDGIKMAAFPDGDMFWDVKFS